MIYSMKEQGIDCRDCKHFRQDCKNRLLICDELDGFICNSFEPHKNSKDGKNDLMDMIDEDFYEQKK